MRDWENAFKKIVQLWDALKPVEVTVTPNHIFVLERRGSVTTPTFHYKYVRYDNVLVPPFFEVEIVLPPPVAAAPLKFEEILQKLRELVETDGVDLSLPGRVLRFFDEVYGVEPFKAKMSAENGWMEVVVEHGFTFETEEGG